MSTASDEIEQSKQTNAGGIIKVVGWSLLVALLTVVIENQATITAWLLQVSPDWLDPIVAKLWAMIISLIMLFVGPNQTKAKSDIVGFYKK